MSCSSNSASTGASSMCSSAAVSKSLNTVPRRYPRSASGEHGDERVDRPDLELRALAPLELFDRLFRSHRAAVRPGGGHGVVGVGHGDHARERGNVFGGDPVGVAGAVPALVVAAHDRGDVVVALDLAQDLLALGRMLAHQRPLVVGEGRRSSAESPTAPRSCQRRAPSRPGAPARTPGAPDPSPGRCRVNTRPPRWNGWPSSCRGRPAPAPLPA